MMMLLMGFVFPRIIARKSHRKRKMCRREICQLQRFLFSLWSNPPPPPFIHASLEGKQDHGLVQALGLNGILHEIRLGDNGCDGQAHGDSHTAQSLRVLCKVFVTAAHVAWIEVGVGAHGREVQRVDARLGEHQDADTGSLTPDAVEIVPSGIARGAVREEGLQEVPHIVHLWRDVSVHPVREAIHLSHVHDRFGASEKEPATDVGGDGAH